MTGSALWDMLTKKEKYVREGVMKWKHKPSSKKGTVLAKLFFSTLYISAFTFGGGFVIVTFMKRKFVDELHWLTEEEMLDMTALAQSSPGAIAVNAAILVGWRVAGFPGMVTAVLGTILPPMLIMVCAFLATFVFEVNVIYIILGTAALDLLKRNVVFSQKLTGLCKCHKQFLPFLQCIKRTANLTYIVSEMQFLHSGECGI